MSRRAAIRERLDAAARQTLMDRAISYVSPETGLKRMRARMVMALAGAYTGASKSRRSMSEWRTRAGDADADTLWDLPTLRERSRDLERNNALAAGAIHTKVTNVVGTGLTLQSNIDRQHLGMSDDEADDWESATEAEWRLWAESQDCDAARTLDFYSHQDLAYRSVLVSGDVFYLLPSIERAGSPYTLALQAIEADRCANPQWQTDTATLSGGVRKDGAGAPVAYYFLRDHPGAARPREAARWAEVPAYGPSGRRNVLHLYRMLRPGQTRGVPDLAPVIETIHQLGRYRDFELSAAEVASLFTVFITTEDAEGLSPMEPVAETGGARDDKDFKLAPAAMLDLAPGEKVEFANPSRPNNGFGAFVQALAEHIGVALEIPHELLLKHFTSSYSAAQAALLEFWKFTRSRRRWLARRFCQPVYEAWLTEAVLLGRIEAPGFLTDPAIRAAYCAATWVGPPREHIDPVKQARADEMEEAAGWKSGAENAAARGNDWDRVHRRRVQEHRRRVADGLTPGASDSAGDESADDLDRRDRRAIG